MTGPVCILYTRDKEGERNVFILEVPPSLRKKTAVTRTCGVAAVFFVQRLGRGRRSGVVTIKRAAREFFFPFDNLESTMIALTAVLYLYFGFRCCRCR